ncbi:MAG: glutamyl-tRNA reductase [Breznakibacter sp.]|nr:glutamyl-tRNA reductase [Breznakibacter sp.]
MRNLVVVGVNYKKTAIDIRNKFAMNTDIIERVYSEWQNSENKDFFILSTCNRTEIYAITDHYQPFVTLLGKYSHATKEEINEFIFVKEGDEAVTHLFRVASGLDSQILGDYEIISQLKGSFNLAKSLGFTSGYFEKMINTAHQSSRAVRVGTKISDGTSSVSYAVIQLLKEQSANELAINICLLGLGKIGSLTFKNLRHYLPQHTLTLINRSEAKAKELAELHQSHFESIDNLTHTLTNTDILIVATSADNHIISKEHVEKSQISTIFDLSVPSNVSPEVKELNHITLYDVDTLSQIVNENMRRRKNDVPLALEIIDKHIAEFKQWEQRRLIYAGQ